MARQTKSAQGPYRVQKATMAQTALNRGDERMKALRESMFELIQMDEPRPVLLGLGEPGVLDIAAPWVDRVEAGRRSIWWRVGVPGARRGCGSHCRVDSA